MTIRFAVLGCGPEGRAHAEMLAHRVAGSGVLVVFDPDPALAAALAADVGARVAPSAIDAVTAVGVDAIAICTGSGSPIEALAEAERAGRPAWCSLAGAAEAGDGAALSGRPFAVGLHRRFDAGHHSVHDAVRRGELGTVRTCRVVSRGVDPLVGSRSLTEVLTEDIDLARFVTGCDVVAVSAQRQAVDCIVVVLTHGNGIVTTIESTLTSPYGPDQRVEVLGDTGMAASENPPGIGGVVATAAGIMRPTLDGALRTRAAVAAQWAAFVASVETGTSDGPTGDDLRAARTIVVAAERAIAERRAIRINDM